MNFCPFCGSSTATTAEETLKPASIDFNEIGDIEDELLWCPQGMQGVQDSGMTYDIWISNNVIKCGGQYLDGDGGIITTSDLADCATFDVDRFSQLFRSAIDEIEQKYGVVVEIRHGVVCFWN